MKSLVALVGVACTAWFVMFSPWTAGVVNFWAAMTVATVVLAGAALWLEGRALVELLPWDGREVVIGVVAAVGLYLFFLVGHMGARALSSFADPQVEAVYATRRQASPLVIGLLLCWIGPAEELFWRGYVQTRLARRFGSWQGYGAASLLYTVVHVWAFNGMLLVAALVCGVFWGGLFLWRRNLTAAVVSHALWDVTIFVLLPVTVVVGR